MAKKCTNELNTLNMADYIFNELPSTPAKGEVNNKRGKLNASNHQAPTTTQRPKKGAARGCKPGYTRHTYVLAQRLRQQNRLFRKVLKTSRRDTERKH